MDVAALRSSVAELDFSLFGVAATLKPPYQTPVSGTIVWLQSEPDAFRGSQELAVRDPKRFMAIQKSELAPVPRGTHVEIVDATVIAGKRIWEVEAAELVETDYTIVKVAELDC